MTRRVAPLGRAFQDIQRLTLPERIKLLPESLIDKPQGFWFFGAAPAVQRPGAAVIAGVYRSRERLAMGGVRGRRTRHQAGQDLAPRARIVRDVPFDMPDVIEAAPYVTVHLHQADIVR